MTDSVIELKDYRPHVVVQGQERTHIAPLEMFHQIAKSDLDWRDVEDGDDMIPTIIGEWLSAIGK